MTDKIRECPCCGGAGEAIRWQRDGYAFAFVQCVGACRLAGHEVHVVGGNMDEAISKAVVTWNRRPREERLVALLREAKETLGQVEAVCAEAFKDAGIHCCPLCGSSWECDEGCPRPRVKQAIAAIGAELGET